MKQSQQMLDIARESGQPVDIRAWDSRGNVILYKGWRVSSSSWKGGWHRIINPVNHEIRTLPDIYIFEINGHPIYL
ncbi:MAG: maintenance system killer protein [Prevotella sp.]|nr:maintenance system killer protein [Prevotella sp.]